MLLAVLANPPLSGGSRTLRRVEQAGLVLGHAWVEIVNLFSLPSRATGAIAELGMTDAGWLSARADIDAKLSEAEAVLLGYGTAPPTGPARTQFRAQVAWLHRRLIERDVPTWWVGDGPRHPSRWQRWTHRAHPDLAFTEALTCSFAAARLTPIEPPASVSRSPGQTSKANVAAESG